MLTPQICALALPFAGNQHREGRLLQGRILDHKLFELYWHFRILSQDRAQARCGPQGQNESSPKIQYESNVLNTTSDASFDYLRVAGKRAPGPDKAGRR